MDYSKLRGRIREKFTTDQAFAQALEVDPSTLSAKLNNRSPWTHNEIVAACRLLGIDLAEAHKYFFCIKS